MITLRNAGNAGHEYSALQVDVQSDFPRGLRCIISNEEDIDSNSVMLDHQQIQFLTQKMLDYGARFPQKQTIPVIIGDSF